MAKTSESPPGDTSERRSNPEASADDIKPSEASTPGLSGDYPDDDPLAELARLVSEDNPFTRLDQFDRSIVQERQPFIGVPEEAPEEDEEDDAEAELAEDDLTVAEEPQDDEPVAASVDPDPTEEPAAPTIADWVPETEDAEIFEGQPEPAAEEPADLPVENAPAATKDMIQQQLADELGLDVDSLVVPPPASSASEDIVEDERVEPVVFDDNEIAGAQETPPPDDLPPPPSLDDLPPPPPLPRFEPVLETPGHPDFDPVLSTEAAESAVEPTIEPDHPVDARAESLEALARAGEEPAVGASDFIMPRDLAASEPISAETDESERREPDIAMAMGAAAPDTVTVAAAPDPAPEPAQGGDDPFVSLEGALKREVDAVLRAGKDDDETEAFEPEADDDSAGRGRGMMIAAAILGLVVLGGLGAFAYRGIVAPTGEDGSPPVIVASEDPLKERPTDPGGTTVENQDSLVFRRASGETDTDQNAQIVPREEQVAAVPAAEKSEDRVTETAGLGEGSRDNPRVIVPQPLAPDDAGVSPRRVRTMIVKPDGTIVRSTDAAEAPAPAPVAPAPAPALATASAPATETQTASAPSTEAPAQDVAATATQPQPDATSEPEPEAATAATATAPEPAAPALALGPEDPSIPLPVARPNAVVASLRTTQQPAQAQPAVATQAPVAAPQPVAGGAYLVQLASRRSQEQALSDFATLQEQYPGILGPYQPFIERADLGSRGIFYRLRVGPLDNQASAGQLCDQLKAAGLPDCLVRRN